MLALEFYGFCVGVAFEVEPYWRDVDQLVGVFDRQVVSTWVVWGYEDQRFSFEHFLGKAGVLGLVVDADLILAARAEQEKGGQ